MQNCFVESFTGTVRDERLNLHWFLSLEDARRTIDASGLGFGFGAGANFIPDPAVVWW